MMFDAPIPADMLMLANELREVAEDALRSGARNDN